MCTEVDGTELMSVFMSVLSRKCGVSARHRQPPERVLRGLLRAVTGWRSPVARVEAAQRVSQAKRMGYAKRTSDGTSSEVDDPKTAHNTIVSGRASRANHR